MFIFKKTEQEKKVAQWWRLIREFPWLWAIKTHWRPGFDDLMVVNTNDSMFTILLGSSAPTTEVWVVKQLFDAIGVERVPYQPGLNVAGMLCEVLDFNEDTKLLHIIAATPTVAGAYLYVIFRLKDGGEQAVNQMIAKALGRQS